MSSFGRSFSAASPVLIVQPQPIHQARHDMGHCAAQHSAPFGSPTKSNLQSHLPLGTCNAAGRKRSRDEAAANLLPDDSEYAPIAPIKEVEDDWEYGEGMVLIKRNQGYVADASSQSGTWVEEKCDQVEAQKLNDAVAQHQERPSLRSHKSQRLDQSTPGILGMESSSGSQLAGPFVPVSSGSLAPMVTEGSGQPVVDDYTLHLGIGWRQISDDEHIQAAARGWAKYIENHYPVSEVTIRLESKGLQSYLVEAAQGFYLFSEDLRQGRLVSSHVNGALRNLRCTPPEFESAETLFALETTLALEAQPATAQQTQPQVACKDVEMGMN